MKTKIAQFNILISLTILPSSKLYVLTYCWLKKNLSYDKAVSFHIAYLILRRYIGKANWILVSI